MPQPGDIVIERLTGNRAILIRVVSPEEMICRFGDGRFEERCTFELEPPPSPLASLLSFFVSSFLSWFRQSPAASVPERSGPASPRVAAWDTSMSRWFRQGAAASVTDRLRLVRPSESSRSPLAV